MKCKTEDETLWQIFPISVKIWPGQILGKATKRESRHVQRRWRPVPIVPQILPRRLLWQRPNARLQISSRSCLYGRKNGNYGISRLLTGSHVTGSKVFYRSNFLTIVPSGFLPAKRIVHTNPQRHTNSTVFRLQCRILLKSRIFPC